MRAEVGGVSVDKTVAVVWGVGWLIVRWVVDNLLPFGVRGLHDFGVKHQIRVRVVDAVKIGPAKIGEGRVETAEKEVSVSKSRLKWVGELSTCRSTYVDSLACSNCQLTVVIFAFLFPGAGLPCWRGTLGALLW